MARSISSIIRRLNDEIRPVIDRVILGQVIDHEDYRQAVGTIAGLQTAIDLLEEAKNQEDESPLSNQEGH